MLTPIHYYISIKLSDIFEEMLFQIAGLYVYSNKSDKLITIPKQSTFISNSKMFDNYSLHDYITVSEEDVQHKIIPYNQNVLLIGKFIDFKPYTDNTLEFMRTFIYSNEDYMYQAYEKYNKIKKHFGINSDELVSMYFENMEDLNKNSISYAKKALILMNKQNIVLFTDNPVHTDDIFDDDHNIITVWDENIYVRFILLSFFKYNVIQYYKSHFSMWAAYISKYQDLKTVVVPDYLQSITNTKINNMHILYVD
jgi:hypothetical protein